MLVVALFIFLGDKMGHYFVNDENLKSNIKEYKVVFNNQVFKFKTDNGVFSKGELDYGTWLLINEVLKLGLNGKGLDLGCGYGPIGIIISKLKDISMDMVDVNLRAVHLTNLNIKGNGCKKLSVFNSDGFSNINSKYDFIISNPPIRVGKNKLYELIKDCRDYLNLNGYIYLVIRKEQGAKSFIADMSKYYKIEVLTKSKGFYIISLKCC